MIVLYCVLALAHWNETSYHALAYTIGYAQVHHYAGEG